MGDAESLLELLATAAVLGGGLGAKALGALAVELAGGLGGDVHEGDGLLSRNEESRKDCSVLRVCTGGAMLGLGAPQTSAMQLVSGNSSSFPLATRRLSLRSGMTCLRAAERSPSPYLARLPALPQAEQAGALVQRPELWDPSAKLRRGVPRSSKRSAALRRQQLFD